MYVYICMYIYIFDLQICCYILLCKKSRMRSVETNCFEFFLTKEIFWAILPQPNMNHLPKFHGLEIVVRPSAFLSFIVVR